jgi:gamma-glutamylaminecyclotransferase
MSKTILFLYGTLKRGQGSNHLLAGQQFIREATTMPLYRLYGCGWHPAMVIDSDHGLEVKGELWAVDDACLAKLDQYEGAPKWFYRGDVAVRDYFNTVQAYLYNGQFSSGVASGDEWPFKS